MVLKTKPWNVDLSTVPADEKLHYDYKSEKKEVSCNVKVKTNRITDWEKYHRLYHFSTKISAEECIVSKWETKPNNCQVLRLIVKTKSKLIISFYHTDGTILVQGDWHREWAEYIYQDVINNLNTTMRKSSDNTNTKDINQTLSEQISDSYDNHDKNNDNCPDLDPITSVLEETIIKQAHKEPDPCQTPHNTSPHAVSRVNLTLSTPHIPGKSKASIITSQFTRLEDKYVNICEEHELRFRILDCNNKDLNIMVNLSMVSFHKFLKVEFYSISCIPKFIIGKYDG